MLYLYAITESDRVPTISGLHGASLRAVGRPPLLAIASEHDDLLLEPAEDVLWSHEQVVEELMKAGSVLPMRFGSSLPDEAAVLAFLEGRRQSLREALECVRGAVELSVRVATGKDLDGRGGAGADGRATGTAYLLDRLERERREKEVTVRVHTPLSSLARASTSWSGELRRSEWKAAYLVNHDRIDAFTEVVDHLDSELGGGGAVICTGPWPPYSFTAGAAAA